jgi:hypothetical protein
MDVMKSLRSSFSTRSLRNTLLYFSGQDLISSVGKYWPCRVLCDGQVQPTADASTESPPTRQMPLIFRGSV